MPSTKILIATIIVIAVAGAVAVAQRGGSAETAMPEQEMENYLTQSVCTDATGRILAILPFEPDCRTSRRQTTDDVAAYRKHDRPNANEIDLRPLGYQASDSATADRGDGRIVIQTLDFGNEPRKFGQFDETSGDGAQVAIVRRGGAYIAVTQDGGRQGLQWFLGRGCDGSSDFAARFESWLLFKSDVVSGEWREDIARLNISPAADTCPTAYVEAYTRYRRDSILLPIYRQSMSGQWNKTDQTFDAIVAEHYGGGSIATADHLERFYFAKGLGWVRWERWENVDRSRRPDVEGMAQALDDVKRCPHVAYADPPGSGWRMVDCHLWTTFEVSAASWRVRDFKWPPRAGLESLAR